jgi:hypothetical protein
MDLSLLANFVPWPDNPGVSGLLLLPPRLASDRQCCVESFDCSELPISAHDGGCSLIRSPYVSSGNSVASARHVWIRHRSPYPSILSWR